MNYRVVEQGYDIAQVCLEGHMVNSSTQNYPQHNRKHCAKCGEVTITACPKCNSSIQGHYYVPRVASMPHARAPLHCHNCGEAFPWTRRRKEAAIELFLEESNLNGEEAEEVRQDIDALVRETSRSPVAASRFKKKFAKLGKATAESVRGILVEIVSESAKKMIWPS
jgi:hypothetical protein